MKRIATLLMMGLMAMPVLAAPKKKNKAVSETASVVTSEAAQTAAAAPSRGAAPELTSKDPKFKGFSGSFLDFGKMSAGSREFKIKVEFAPWFFEYTGKVNAAHNTADLDIMFDQMDVVIAYYDAPGVNGDGVPYQAGIFDVMLYLDDEPTRITEATVRLLGPASAGASTLAKALTWGSFAPGAVFTNPNYSKDITTAQGDALDKADIVKAKKAEEKRIADSIADYKKEQKRLADSTANYAREQKRLEKERERKRLEEQQRLADEEAARQAVLEKKKKKKKVIAEEATEDEAVAAEDEAPVVKKKKKKKKVIAEEAVEDEAAAVEEEAPVVKKKKKKKKVVVEDEESSEE